MSGCNWLPFLSVCIILATDVGQMEGLSTNTKKEHARMYEVEQEQPPIVYMLDGLLSEGRRLAHPLAVEIEHDDGEVVVSEPHFHIHASAPTQAEAIAAFRRIFSGYLDVLTAEEKILGTHLREQLEYLRSVIRSA